MPEKYVFQYFQFGKNTFKKSQFHPFQGSIPWIYKKKCFKSLLSSLPTVYLNAHLSHTACLSTLVGGFVENMELRWWTHSTTSLLGLNNIEEKWMFLQVWLAKWSGKGLLEWKQVGMIGSSFHKKLIKSLIIMRKGACMNKDKVGGLFLDIFWRYTTDWSLK